MIHQLIILQVLERICPSKEISNVSDMKESLEAQWMKSLEGGMTINKMNNDVKSSKKNRNERSGTRKTKRVRF